MVSLESRDPPKIHGEQGSDKQAKLGIRIIWELVTKPRSCMLFCKKKTKGDC